MSYHYVTEEDLKKQKEQQLEWIKKSFEESKKFHDLHQARTMRTCPHCGKPL